MFNSRNNIHYVLLLETFKPIFPLASSEQKPFPSTFKMLLAVAKSEFYAPNENSHYTTLIKLSTKILQATRI